MSDPSRLTHVSAIITGAAQGIGRTYAIALADAGMKVCVSDVNTLDETLAEIHERGGTAIGIEADIASQVSLDALAAGVEAKFGRIDVLVNNAAMFGRLQMGPFDSIAQDEWDRVMMVNVRGVWQSIKAVVPAMRRTGGGKIINIASTVALKGTPMMMHYAASKGAVVALTRAAAAELGDAKICVNAIAPGLVMSSNVQGHPYLQSVASAVAAQRAIKRDSVPEDLVGALRFLASPASDFITGQILVVDGGGTWH